MPQNQYFQKLYLGLQICDSHVTIHDRPADVLVVDSFWPDSSDPHPASMLPLCVPLPLRVPGT